METPNCATPLRKAEWNVINIVLLRNAGRRPISASSLHRLCYSPRLLVQIVLRIEILSLGALMHSPQLAAAF